MNMYRNWHMELKPKSEFSYFAEQLSKYSGKKEVKEHMEKLRNVYRGDVDHFVPFGPDPDTLINLKDGIDPPPATNTAQPAQNGSIPKATDKNDDIPQFSY